MEERNKYLTSKSVHRGTKTAAKNLFPQREHDTAYNTEKEREVQIEREHNRDREMARVLPTSPKSPPTSSSTSKIGISAAHKTVKFQLEDDYEEFPTRPVVSPQSPAHSPHETHRDYKQSPPITSIAMTPAATALPFTAATPTPMAVPATPTPSLSSYSPSFHCSCASCALFPQTDIPAHLSTDVSQHYKVTHDEKVHHLDGKQCWETDLETYAHARTSTDTAIATTLTPTSAFQPNSSAEKQRIKHAKLKCKQTKTKKMKKEGGKTKKKKEQKTKIYRFTQLHDLYPFAYPNYPADMKTDQWPKCLRRD